MDAFIIILHLDLENNKKFDLKKTSSHPNS